MFTEPFVPDMNGVIFINLEGLHVLHSLLINSGHYSLSSWAINIALVLPLEQHKFLNKQNLACLSLKNYHLTCNLILKI